MPGITGDPHLKGGDGDLTDFKGEDNTVYNVLSARNFSVNVLFWHDVFPMSHKLVEGSFMKQAFITGPQHAMRAPTACTSASLIEARATQRP